MTPEVKHEIQEIMSEDSDDYLVTESEVQKSMDFTNIKLINDHVYKNWTVPPAIPISQEKKVDSPIQEDQEAEEIKPSKRTMAFSIFKSLIVGGNENENPEPAVKPQAP